MPKHVSCSIAAAAVLAGLTMLATPRAHATIINEHVAFSATNFNFINGISPPTDPVTGSFDITFDNTQSYSDATSGISNGLIDIGVGSAFSFNYDPTVDFLVIGGLANGAGTIAITPAGDDFYLQFSSFSTAPVLYQLGYAQSAETDGYYYTDQNDPANTVTTSAIVPSSDVPEPATWAVLLTVLVGAGFVMRRRAR